MRRLLIPLMLSVALCTVVGPLTAQVNTEDTRTPEQKWARSMFMTTFSNCAILLQAKALGQSEEDLGEWMVELIAPTWGEPGARPMASFVSSMLLNYGLWEGLEVEIETDTEAEIKGHMNMPFAPFFGDEGESYGVTLDQFVWMNTTIYEGTADYLGFDMTHEVDGERIHFTVKARE